MSTRVSCGTVFGTQLHLSNGEQLCSTCRLAERARAVTAERAPVPEPADVTVQSLLRDTIHALATAMGTPRHSL
jgi:hypothetical protein